MATTDASTLHSFLHALEGDLLPERAALSLITPNVLSPAADGGTGPAPAPDPQGYVVSDGHGGTVYYACQTTHTDGTGGVLGAVGVGRPASTTTTCMPAAVTSH
ncbi:hypothetical protein GCM10017786_50080 [Amycolatopsis deserti]|uniref:Uncharacterized protein n=1 Tax=Amycolatopsis deserti TaxID=185696 RepID=A0ABQ3JE04_9PSEU|nr:hypothetical protein [Amycolatopsis deserti]GHF10390.1 hypothetical protein GCM10017786_50080 [Amycolatopsis deserti]